MAPEQGSDGRPASTAKTDLYARPVPPSVFLTGLGFLCLAGAAFAADVPEWNRLNPGTAFVLAIAGLAVARLAILSMWEMSLIWNDPELAHSGLSGRLAMAGTPALLGAIFATLAVAILAGACLLAGFGHAVIDAGEALKAAGRAMFTLRFP